MSKTKAFDAQIAGIVNKTREDIYGPPAAHFKASAAIKAILREANERGRRRTDIMLYTFSSWRSLR